jgi:hypothetical protein
MVMAEFVKKLRNREDGDFGEDYSSSTVTLWKRDDLPGGRMYFHVREDVRSDWDDEVWDLTVRPSKEQGKVLGQPVVETGGGSDFPSVDQINDLIDALTQEQIDEAFRLAAEADEQKKEPAEQSPGGLLPTPPWMLPYPPPPGGYTKEQLDAARAASPYY